jgi:hypothetical protein
MTPSRIHSQSRPEPDPLPAAGELLGSAATVGVAALLVADGSADVASALGLGEALALGVGEALALGVGEALALGVGEALALGVGDELALGSAEALALRVGAMLAIALLVLSHPATMHPMARIAAKRTRPLVKRRMPDPSARPFKAGCFGRHIAP